VKIMIGIYKITNKINGKSYIGQSVDIQQRWNAHKSKSKSIELGGDNYAIHCAIRKYGVENFTFEVIEQTTQQELNSREKYWIKYYDTYYNGYNSTLGGDSGCLYDYQSIIDLWDKGYQCNKIETILGCSDQVITRALHSYDISEEEIRACSNTNLAKPIVAIDITSNKSLKIFNNVWDVNYFFTGIRASCGALNHAIANHWRWNGYYWELLTENNKPQNNLTNEEFLTYQHSKLYTRSDELRLQISIANRQVERCSKDELKNLIRKKSFAEIGKQFNITDNGIRKWCDYYHLPRRKKDIKLYSDEEWDKL
jgi:hypothetical protein